MTDDFNLSPTDAELRELQAPSEPSFEQQLHLRYDELMRDKRSVHDLDCPTWANGCRCLDMVVGHPRAQGRPWCAPCQKAHDPPIHQPITQQQFVKRFQPKEQEEGGYHHGHD